jgi:DNA-binding NtrC family response regulator
LLNRQNWRSFWLDFVLGGAPMQTQWNVLVASSHLENRRALVQILQGLPLIDVFSSSNLQQAEEVIEGRSVALVFCDDNLLGGSYQRLLSRMRSSGESFRFIVTTIDGEWEDYLEATQQGAFDMIRWPLQPTDVEMIVIRAMREEERKASSQMIA